MPEEIPLKIDPATQIPAQMEAGDTIPASMIPAGVGGYSIPQMWVFG